MISAGGKGSWHVGVLLGPQPVLMPAGGAPTGGGAAAGGPGGGGNGGAGWLVGGGGVGGLVGGPGCCSYPVVMLFFQRG